MTGHTPGPWVVSFDPNEPDSPQVYGNRNGRFGPFVADVVQPADARLIAAAPDLLAALEAFCGFPIMGGDPVNYAGLVDTGRRLIAKAKGES